MWKCSGALICEYLKPSLCTLYHTYLDDAAWEEIQNIRKNIDLIEGDIRKRNAYRWVASQVVINQLPTTYELIALVYIGQRRLCSRKAMHVLSNFQVVSQDLNGIFTQ
jgi:hypothetical protein